MVSLSVSSADHSEQLLEERELLFRTLTEQIQEVFIVAKPNNIFVYVSPAYEEIGHERRGWW